MLAAGCGPHGPALSEFDADQLLSYAIDRMQAEKWTDATRALETFIFQYPTHPRYQEARFHLGEAYEGKGEHLTAGSEFARLADDYPNGEYADDARFRVCESYAEVSPDPQLDQEYTRTAIVHCESLIGNYPDSEYVPRAQALVVDMRNKLAEKLYLTGRNYVRLKVYDSAIIYFNDVLDTYPTTVVAPKALYGLYQTYEKIGYVEDASAAKERLLRDYPDSQEARRMGGGSPGES